MGIGGVGINAVQGAVAAGAHRVIAVDPIAFKREAALRFGATHTLEVDATRGSRSRGCWRCTAMAG
nr:zinc-binding dehydrogenase [Frankia sp. Cr1]